MPEQITTKTINQLDALTTPSSSDLLVIRDAEASKTKKISYNDLVGSRLTEIENDIDDIENDVAELKRLKIGDQITLFWTDTAAGVDYEVPHDIVHYGPVELEGGGTANAWFLSWHYCTPFDIQFDNYEGFFADEENALPAGTYNVTMGLNWGTYVVKDKVYQFTTTVDMPAGGCLSGFERCPDVAPENWSVKVWDATHTTVLETVSVTEGSAGTSLGTFTAAGNADLNSIQCVAYGSNRDMDSALRQWLNSAEGVGLWWTKAHKYDTAPTQLATKAGFLSGYPEAVRNKFAKTKIRTARNTVKYDGGWDEYYDKVFSPAKEQIYNTPQIEGEGVYWEYWKARLGLSSPSANHPTTYPAYKIPAINAKTTAQAVRLRSASRNDAAYTWHCGAGGYVIGHTSYTSHRALPSLVILESDM